MVILVFVDTLHFCVYKLSSRTLSIYLIFLFFFPTGDYCEVTAARQIEPIQVIIPLVILAILLACAAVYLWWYLKQSRKMKGKYNPAKEELAGGMPMATFDLETDERLI